MNINKYNKKQNEENKKIIALDFDGVIHKNSKGFHDGTIYDDPIEGSIESIRDLHKKGFKLIIFTCKGRTDRPLIDNKTGIDLIWEWLKKHNIEKCITDVVWEKPWALIYVDDKAYKFENWNETVQTIKNLK